MEFLKTGCDNIEYNLILLICVTFDKIEGKIKGTFFSNILMFHV